MKKTSVWPRVFGRVAYTCLWLVLLASAIAVGIGLWVRRTFGPISFDQLFSNLPGGGGEGAGGDELVVRGIITGIVVPVAIVAVLFVVTEIVRRSVWTRRIKPRALARRSVRGLAALMALAVAFASGTYLVQTIGVREVVDAYVAETIRGTNLGDYYVAPSLSRVEKLGADDRGDRDADAAPETPKRNLVTIYLESIEETLGDDAVFEKNMLAPLENATKDWDALPTLDQYEGGGWTMAGIVSTQCGIPLRSQGAVSDPRQLNLLGAEGNEVTTYLEGATCLGDVMEAAGYRNVYMGGADTRFAGKGAFWKTHGYKEVYGLTQWDENAEWEYRPDWGLSDRRLMDYAIDEIDELHAGKDPFNFTLLTLDTHEPPWVHPYCDVDTEQEATAITFCSMQQVSRFIKHMEKKGYLDDTVVVIMGDHQKMVAEGGSFWDELGDREDRPIFNRVWSPDGVEFERSRIDQLSMYPTLLELMGFEPDDHRAGVGVSALANPLDVPEGSVLDLTDDEYLDIVRSPSSAFYERLWGPEDQTSS